MKIQLYNRDGANLWLEKLRDIEPYISEWSLKANSDYEYCLKYIRVIGDFKAIDPPGGPFLALGDELDYFPRKYKIVKIKPNLTIWLSERNNNN